jgi:N6-L-threonylcarbamoyladenine synthase
MNGCLSVSINAAKNLAAALNKPIVGVHHMVLPNPTSVNLYPVSDQASSKRMP